MTDGEKQFIEACSKYNKLCKERRDPSQWSDNIIDATTGITENVTWTNFYSFLSNEEHAYSESKTRTLGDVLNEGPITPIESEIKLKTTRVQNGNVTYIRVTPDISGYIENNNGRKKSMDNILEILDEKSPR